MSRTNEQELIYRHIVGYMHGDGSMFGRMNAVEGGWQPPKSWDELARQLELEGFTPETVGAEMHRRWNTNLALLEKLAIEEGDICRN